jgi:hypothetical protein
LLQNLSQQVRNCLEHAEDCAHCAKIECDPSLVRDFLDMERRWLRLARSYQVSEQLEAFSRHDKKRQDDAAEISTGRQLLKCGLNRSGKGYLHASETE